MTEGEAYMERLTRENKFLVGALARAQRMSAEAQEAARETLQRAERYSRIAPDALEWDAVARHVEARVSLDKDMRQLAHHFEQALKTCAHIASIFKYLADIMPPGLRLLKDMEPEQKSPVVCEACGNGAARLLLGPDGLCDKCYTLAL